MLLTVLYLSDLKFKSDFTLFCGISEVVSGRRSCYPDSRARGLHGLVFLGIVHCVAELSPAKKQTGVFLTTHSLDRKLVEADQW